MLMIFSHKGLVMSNNYFHDQSYTLADYVARLANQITSSQRDELCENFFAALEKTAQLPSCAKKISSANTHWPSGIWAHLSPEKTAPKRGQNRAGFKELAANIDYYKRFGVKTFLLKNFFPTTEPHCSEIDYYRPIKQMGGDVAFDYFMEKCRIYDLEVVISFPLLAQTNPHLALPEALSATWKLLGFWQARGLRGIQLEWDGKDLQPTQVAAIVELHQLFVQTCDPSAIVIWDESSVLQLPYQLPIQHNCSLSWSILFACLLENFALLGPTYRRPPTAELLYLGNSHRPYDFGQLPAIHSQKERLERLRKQILQANGVLGAEGTTGAACMASLFGQNLDAYFSYSKFLLGHVGTIIYYQGTELGLGNNYLALNLGTLDQLEERLGRGENLGGEIISEVERMEKNPQYLNATPSDLGRFPYFQQYYQLELLHEQTTTQTAINQALAGDNPYYQRHCQLTKRRSQSKCLTYGQASFPLNTMREDIGSFVRRWYDANQELLEEVAIIKNSKSAPTTVNLCKSDLTALPSFQLFELEEQRIVPFEWTVGQDFITLHLGPYETLWLKVMAPGTCG